MQVRLEIFRELIASGFSSFSRLYTLRIFSIMEISFSSESQVFERLIMMRKILSTELIAALKTASVAVIPVIVDKSIVGLLNTYTKIKRLEDMMLMLVDIRSIQNVTIVITNIVNVEKTWVQPEGSVPTACKFSPFHFVCKIICG